MSPSWHDLAPIRRLAAQEQGCVDKEASTRIALVYPSPYHVAMSSLGYQTIYRLINQREGFAADRAMLPERKVPPPNPLVTIERGRPLGDYPVLAFSIAYELEIAGLLECLERSGIPPLREDRGTQTPLIIAGGPLTFSNPVPVGLFVDIILMGEAEEIVIELLEIVAEHPNNKEDILAQVSGRPGFYVPQHDGDRMPLIAKAPSQYLPARSQIITPNTELSSMYLTEAARGCSRGCTYCVMRRSTNGGMRIIPQETILAHVPQDAPRVGLVGAAVTDHPEITDIVAALVARNKQVGISSLRADKLSDDLVRLLAKGGYRTLTVAFDGASARLRNTLERRTKEQHILNTAALAKKHRLYTVKLYMMVGVPGETDDDIEELIRFIREAAQIHRISLGVAPFVAKRNTPLDGTPFAGIPVVRTRLARLHTALRGVATIRPTSARWAWVEYMLAQGSQDAGMAVLDAYRAGGTFAAYKRAFAQRACQPTGPVARVPSTAERLAQHAREKALPVLS